MFKVKNLILIINEIGGDFSVFRVDGKMFGKGENAFVRIL